IPLPTHYVYFGEVSLSGAIRSVVHSGQRIKEAKKLGFQGAFQPIATTETIKLQNFQQHTFSDLPELIAAITSDKKRSVPQKIIKEKIP
ncbi:MAG: DNA repair protein RadA, partial [Bartonella sp.]|nr:DNA repair protein RadA [Bartonella sp.]